MKFSDVLYGIRHSTRLRGMDNEMKILQMELSRATEQLKQQEKSEWDLTVKLEDALTHLEHDSQQLALCGEALKDVCDSSKLDAESLYNLVAPYLDPEGWTRYQIAKELTGVNVYSDFYTEDNLGYFEGDTATVHMRYLEASAFGAVEYEIMPNTCYERAVLGEVDCNAPSYLEYREKLHQRTLEKLGCVKEKQPQDRAEPPTPTKTKKNTKEVR